MALSLSCQIGFRPSMKKTGLRLKEAYASNMFKTTLPSTLFLADGIVFGSERLEPAKPLGPPSNRSPALSALGGFRVFDDGPALQPRNRLRLFDRDSIADLATIVFVMRVKILRPAHRLLEKRMRETALALHDDGLVLLIADDDTLQDTFRHFISILFVAVAARSCDGLRPRYVAPHDPHAGRILQLSSRPLKAQI